jgi:hypothetical protein
MKMPKKKKNYGTIEETRNAVEISYEQSTPDEIVNETWCKCSYIIEPVVFLQNIASSIIGIAFSQFVYNRILTRIESNNNNSTLPVNFSLHDSSNSTTNEIIQAQRETANLFFLMALFGGIPCIFASMILGVNTSKLGRRLLLIISLISINVRNLIYVYQAYYPELPDYIFLVSSLIDGITGSSGVFYLALHCFITDITQLKSRSYRLTLINYTSSITSLIVSYTSGYMIKYLGYFYLFILSFAFNFSALLYTILFVPEPIRSLNNKSLFARIKSCSIKRIFNCIKVYLRKTEPNIVGSINNENSNSNSSIGIDKPRQYVVLILLVVANLIYCFGANGVGSIFTLYTMNIPFNWGSIEISTFTFYNTLLSLFLSLVVSKFLKIDDIIICFLSAFSYFISLFIFGFATTSAYIYLGAGVSAISGLEFGYVRSIVSKLVTKYEVADALTLITVVDTFAAVVASIILPYIYSNYVSTMNRLIFFIVAPFIATTCILHL